MKANLGLVEFCKQEQAAGTGYVYGTFGDVCTTSLLDQCAKRYPDKYGDNPHGGYDSKYELLRMVLSTMRLKKA